MREYDIAIIGGGAAGMAAALGAAEPGAAGAHSLSILLCERGDTLGGILNQCLHTGFGTVIFGRELTGPEFAEHYIRRVKSSSIEVMTGTTATALDGTGHISLSAAGGFDTVRARAVILASGCRERPAGALPISGTRPSGIFTAGAAQRLINLGGYDIGRRAVIIGSGDVGLIVAGRLRELGADVAAVLEQSDRCGGLERNRARYIDRYGIPLITRCTVCEIHGSSRITGVTARSLDGGGEWHIPCDTLITSVGLVPERELLSGAAADGQLPDWLFLCGNACYVHDSVDDVAEESARAGAAAAAFVSGAHTGASGRVTERASATRGTGGNICLACPKACAVTLTPDGWDGMVCGRRSPVLT